MTAIALVGSEDFSPRPRRTEVLTTNLRPRRTEVRTIEPDRSPAMMFDKIRLTLVIQKPG
ncbi:hypothetical protein C7B69_22690 [filamentous cyanobacterium Phorm 46]|nr:hypothetical protein C7B69_22690 [filamentous cyanobacterium Phorm 46]